MTVKELAIFTGKTERTIRNWISKTGDELDIIPPEEISQGIAHNYSVNEVESILNSGSMSKDAVRILMENARNQNLPAQIMKESILTPKDMQMIGVIVGEIMKTMESRVSNIEQKFEARKALLPPPEMEPKQQLRKILNSYCGRIGCEFWEAYNDLYREFNYIYHVNAQLAARNRNKSVLNYITYDLKMINELISVASKIFAEGQLI